MMNRTHVLRLPLCALLQTALAHAAPPFLEPRDDGRVLELFNGDHLTGGWFGVRNELEERGITFEADLLVDWSYNFRGGLRSGSSVYHLFVAGLTIDTQRLFGHAGGTFYAEFQTNDGDMPSSDLVGDLQVFSNIENEHRTQLAELWFEQWIIPDALRIKVGKVDANSEFAYVEHGLEFINSSMGVSPTIFAIPTFPDPATSINIFLYPQENVYLGLGVYDGAGARGVRTGSRGPSTLFHSTSDLFFIGEGGLLWECSEAKLPGRIGIGAWHHSSDFERFTGESISGTTGFYMVLDQTLWRVSGPGGEIDDGPHIGAFVQYGYADPSVSEFEHHVGGGLIWRGPLPGREDDALGAAASWVRLSDQAGFDHHTETVVEFFYQAQVTPWLMIQPDLQYIRNPGGARGRRSALVGTLRFGVSF